MNTSRYLFRGLTSQGSWVYGDLCHDTETLIRTTKSNGLLADVPVLPETVGQWTGLTDANGEKIWEGDVVQGDWIHEDHEINGAIIEVKHIPGGYTPFMAPRGDGSGYLYGTECLPENFIVIGNIHQNPELCEG